MTKTTAVYSQSNLLELGDGNTNACDIFMDGRLPFDCSSFDAFVRLRRPHLLRMNILFLISKNLFTLSKWRSFIAPRVEGRLLILRCVRPPSAASLTQDEHAFSYFKKTFSPEQVA